MFIQFTLLFSSFLRSDNVSLRAYVTSVMFPDNIRIKPMSQGFSILYVEIQPKGYLGVHYVNLFLIPIPQAS